MREFKFRAWNLRKKTIEYIISLYWFEENFVEENGDNDFLVMQYTGLKDKSGKEIYELCEINGKFIVVYLLTKYVLYEISNGDRYDLLEYDHENELEITTEYKELSENQKRYIDKCVWSSKTKESS